MRGVEAFARYTVEIFAFQFFTRGIGYRVNQDIQVIPEIIQFFKNGGDIFITGDIAG